MHNFKPGDTFKIKILGVKRKVYILQPNDIIDENCLVKYVLDFQPMCYDLTVRSCNFESSGWMKTAYKKEENETVSDDHTHRVYIRILK